MKPKLKLVKGKAILAIFLWVFLIEIILFSSIFNLISYKGFLANIASGVLIDLTNMDRASLSIDKLTASPLLEEAANLKAKDMAEKGYFAHTSPEGITPWYWFSEVGYRFKYAGENLGVNFTDSNLLHQAWLDSVKHKKNILNENFTEIGVGTAEGIYKGRSAVFVVQMFGSPKSIALESDSQPSPRVGVGEEEPVVALTDVLGAEAQPEVITESDSFVLAKDPSLPDEKIVAGSSPSIQYSTFLIRILSTPKILNALLLILASIGLLLALFHCCTTNCLNIYSLSINSLIVFFVIIGSLIINHWVFVLTGLVS